MEASIKAEDGRRPLGLLWMNKEEAQRRRAVEVASVGSTVRPGQRVQMSHRFVK